jgi:hypothetical protein
MNPGEHNLIVDAVENTQLRVQKDLGTEYQTVGNPNNVQGSQSPWKNNVVYFSRGDKDLLGNSISPLSSITQIPTHNGKSIANNGIQDSGKMITDYNNTTGEWTYDPQKNTDWLNYCDYNTDTWSGVDTSNRTDNSGTSTSRNNQTDKTCYHNDSSETHFWQYDWSKTGWYAQDPRPASFVQNN